MPSRNNQPNIQLLLYAHFYSKHFTYSQVILKLFCLKRYYDYSSFFSRVKPEAQCLNNVPDITTIRKWNIDSGSTDHLEFIFLTTECQLFSHPFRVTNTKQLKDWAQIFHYSFELLKSHSPFRRQISKLIFLTFHALLKVKKKKKNPIL